MEFDMECTNCPDNKQFWDQVIKEENEQRKKDMAIIRKIKKEIPRKLFKQLNSEIYESVNYQNFRIVNEPVGEEQGYGRNVWVDQRTGYFGDDYHGTVCFKLPDETFLAWDYWM